MTPVLFIFYFSYILEFAFGNFNTGIKFQLFISGEPFNYWQFEFKTLTKASIICDLLFTNDVALIATSFHEACE